MLKLHSQLYQALRRHPGALPEVRDLNGRLIVAVQKSLQVCGYGFVVCCTFSLHRGSAEGKDANCFLRAYLNFRQGYSKAVFPHMNGFASEGVASPANV